MRNTGSCFVGRWGESFDHLKDESWSSHAQYLLEAQSSTVGNNTHIFESHIF
jgi:hypothetical protein